MKSAAKILLLFLLLLLIVSGLSAYWTFYKLVPSPKRTIEIQGLNSEVIVQWDDNMIPHISAESEFDAFAMTGYLHARDRLWQMTRYQYKLEGLHSREIDESLLNLDIFYLTMPFAENSRNAFEMLSGREQQLLISYASGINQYIENNRKHLPIEFTLSNARPVTWEPWHALGVQLLWGWQQQQSFWSKLAFSQIHELRDPAATRALTGSNVAHTALFGNLAPLLNTEMHYNLLRDFLSFTEPVYPDRTILPGTGFAISTQHSQPLNMVSMTRELPLTLPDQGYEMTVNIGGNKRSGITIPGFPIMISGQNNHIAWAIQPLALDDGDFFTGRLFSAPMAEPVDWKHDATVIDHLSDDIKLTRHILEMKNGAEYQVVTRKSGGRPMIAVSEQDNTYLAFDWAGFLPPNDFGSFFDMTVARSLTDLEIAVRGIQTPAVQVLAADRNGNSGRFYGGQTLNRTHPLKIRDSGEATSRTDVTHILTQQLEANGMPVFVLEDQPAAIPSDRYISLYFTPWSRSHRLQELIETTPASDLPVYIANQWYNDTFSKFAASLTPEIIRSLRVAPDQFMVVNSETATESDMSDGNENLSDTEAERDRLWDTYNEFVPDESLMDIIFPYLQNWNYEYKSNETAATIFEFFLVKASENLYEAYLGEMEIRLIFTTPQVPLAAVSHLISHPDDWPDTHPLTFREWMAKSMEDAASELIMRYGDEPHDWQWGSVIKGQFQSSLFAATIEQSRAARLADRNLYNPGDFPISGTSHTIHSAHFNFRKPFEMTSATSHKRIMILAPDQKTFSTLSTGQSGNIFSDHFNDQFSNWKNGINKVRPFEVSSDFNAKHRQRFIPETP